MKTLVTIILTLFSNILFSQSIDYFGQTAPSDTPVIFAPQILSIKNSIIHTFSFSKDGLEFYFSRYDSSGYKTMYCHYDSGNWSVPQEASFKGWEAIFSPDGTKLIFGDGDLWFISKTKNSWTEPRVLDFPVSSDNHDYYASTSNNGTLYFSRIISEGNQKIFYSKLTDGKYSEIEEIDSVINVYGAFHPFIAPDESYLIFNSNNNPVGFGQADLYVSFRDSVGEWIKPINLGESINTSAREICPIISPDGKYLFFTRQNGQTGTPYWISSSIIDKLRLDNINKK